MKQTQKTVEKAVEMAFYDFPLEALRFLESLNDSALFEFDNGKLKTTVVDRAMVGLAKLEYEGEGKGKVKFGVSIANMRNALKFLDAYNTFWKADKSSLVLNGGNRMFKLSLLDVSQEDIPNVDELDWKDGVKFEMYIDTLRKIIKKVEWFADYLIFEIDNGLKVKAVSDLIEFEESFNIGLNATKKFRVSFSLEYLRYLTLLKDGSLEIYLKKDYPAKFVLEKDGLRVEYILAPRVEEEEWI